MQVSEYFYGNFDRTFTLLPSFYGPPIWDKPTSLPI